jgi:hypothetical protein
MKSFKIISLVALLFLSSLATVSCYFDSDNPPNPLDAKAVSMDIVNKTNENIKVSFFLDGKKQFHGVVVPSGRSNLFNIEGRYNKKRAYFRFRKAEVKGGDVRFFYKKIAKARGIKLNRVYLLQNDSKLVVSATEEYNPASVIMEANMSDL